MVFYSFQDYFFSIKGKTNKREQIVQRFILKQNFGQKNWQNGFHFANLKNEKNYLLSFTCSKTSCYGVPIDQIPKSGYVVGTAILVMQIISVFPNVQTQNRRAS